MKIKNLKLKILALSAYLLICLFIIRPSTNAQQFSAGVSPTNLEIKAEPPADIQAPLILENKSDQNITYGIFLRPFKAGPDLNGEPNYDPDLSNEYEKFFEKVQIYDGNEAVSEISLRPKEKKDITLSINLDEESEARDYYFTVIFLSKPPASPPRSTNSQIRGGIGTNVLLSVGSDSESAGRIANFDTPFFVNQGPVEFGVEIANHSDHFVSPRGNLVVRNMFGQAVGSVEFGPVNLLKDSNRLERILWDEKFPIGVYKAELSVAISESGPVIKKSKLFVAMPIKLLIISVALITSITWLTVSVKRKYKQS